MHGMASLNAGFGAIGLVAGSGATVALGLAPELVALRFVALGVFACGAWAFADEMGADKPLNRAGLVCLGFAVVAKILVLLGVDGGGASAGVLYAFALLFALLFWSIAFLHRGTGLKAIGAVGASMAVVPILILVAGHVFVGFGALWGMGALYSGMEGALADALRIVLIVEIVCAVWSVLAGIALWMGWIEA